MGAKQRIMGVCVGEEEREAKEQEEQEKRFFDLHGVTKDEFNKQAQLAKEAERQLALDAETIPLNMNGPDGKFDHDARLNGTLKELTEKVVLKLGLTKECAEHVEMHLSGYKLEPVTKIVREFTELCAGSEIDLEGIEKAQEAMQKHKAAKLDVHAAAIDGNLAQLNLVAEFAPERINEASSVSTWTPLHCAAAFGQEAAVSLLLSAKADVNKTDSD